MKLSKDKYKDLGSNDPMNQYKLGLDLLEDSLGEDSVGILVDNKLAMNHQCALVAKKGQ